jgi:hypothetical protein
MSNEERPYFDTSSSGKTIINDPKLAEFYKEGFRLAINYLHVNLPKEGGEEMNQKNFKDLVNSILTDVKIEDDFFVNHPILPATPIYPVGLCPGPGGTCIDCPDGSFGSA